MATPDQVSERFNDTRTIAEARGDFVVIETRARSGELITEQWLSLETARALSGQMLLAVAAIDTRNATLAGPQPAPTYADPCPPGYREVDTAVEGWVPGDYFDPSTGKTYRQGVEQPEADISEWADAAPKLAASA